MTREAQVLSLVQTAGRASVGALFTSIAKAHPDRTALVDGPRSLTYAELERRSNRLANGLLAQGIRPGERIAVLSRNRLEYFEWLLAAAKSGTILAALNWRLSAAELAHCVNLVAPRALVVAGELAAAGQAAAADVPRLILEEDHERLMTGAPDTPPELAVDPEEGLVILYTSGTTGLPKGALISHRALIARGLVYHYVMQVPDRNHFVAWTPFYHMVAIDHGLATLLAGGTLWCVDGFDMDALCPLIERLPMAWFVLVPGMVGAFNEEVRRRGLEPRGIGVIGAMPDLIPPEEIAEATRLLRAPFLNTFGSTETGLPPGTGGRIPVGEVPTRLSKTQTPFCDLILVDPEGNEVPVGEPGEAAVAGPTLFSGYWQADEVNRRDFRGGRFHMGDVLRRNPDGTLDYVDRVKYLIKSGGENIYPAEVEAVLAADPRIATAVVVRAPDPRWGEVPVAFVVRRDPALSEEEVIALCRDRLASYKRPKRVLFVAPEEIPRSTTGKIQRHLLEARLTGGGGGG
ncbi:MAG: fatty-acyl-CoA synthase [Porticoccaceae bacterium]|nr:MAG: fatty-acyl-CoA synthase [Porticoccaceae bacterium]